jgi:hypothetical protein
MIQSLNRTYWQIRLRAARERFAVAKTQIEARACQRDIRLAEQELKGN